MDDATLSESVWQTLEGVIDPELGLPITDLGLVYNVEVVGGEVHVEMTTTTPICPLGDYLAGLAETRLKELAGVVSVEVALTRDPPWTPEMLSDRARSLLGIGAG